MNLIGCTAYVQNIRSHNFNTLCLQRMFSIHGVENKEDFSCFNYSDWKINVLFPSHIFLKVIIEDNVSMFRVISFQNLFNRITGLNLRNLLQNPTVSFTCFKRKLV